MIRRTYECTGCDLEWTVTHDSSDDPYPPCPVCTIKASWVPKPLRIKTNKSRAMDVAQRESERMGLSNMKDNTREGESVYMAPPAPTTADNEAVMHQTVDAMRQLANRSTGSVSPQMAEFLKSTGNTLTDPTVTQALPTNLIGASNVVKLPAPSLQLAAQATAIGLADPNNGGMTPTGMLHKAMKHQRSDPLRSQIMARYRP